MDVSEVLAASPFTVQRIHPDESRGRQPDADTAERSPPPVFVLPLGPAFDSAAPVAVDAATEAAMADLRPVDGLPLAEAIHRYVDAD